jgi:hypothetical protein
LWLDLQRWHCVGSFLPTQGCHIEYTPITFFSIHVRYDMQVQKAVSV